MGELHDKMLADLKIGGYAVNTQNIYLLYAKQFAKYFMRSPRDMGLDEIREFMLINHQVMQIILKCENDRDMFHRGEGATLFCSMAQFGTCGDDLN